MNKQKRAVVIGAGISGLCSAYWLQENGWDVSVYEKTDHVGGSIITEKKDGYLIDLGPNSALETSDVLRNLISELGLADQKIYGNEASNNRYVVRDGILHPIPMSPVKFLKTKLFSAGAKLRLLKEPFIKPTSGDDISLADFVRYRLGQEFLDYAINPFVAGVYAGDPEQLSTAAAFPKLYALEQTYGSFIKGTIKGARERKKRNEVSKDRAKLFSFLNGLETFPRALASRLKGNIYLNSPIERIVKDGESYRLEFADQDKSVIHADHVLISIPTNGMSHALRDISPQAAEQIAHIKYPPVAVIFTAFDAKQIKRPLDGFGYLIPKIENRNTLGTIWSSTIFPGRAPEGKVAFTTFVGGTRQPENAGFDDAKLTDIVLRDLEELVGIDGKPELVRIKRWQRAIPQYTLGYKKYQHLFDTLEQDYPGLYFAGNFRRGISLGDSVLCAHETVQKMISDQT